ncbi:FixH family protein [Ramlibacter sp. H39-3-26]|uniref:FixH family protein n=1 Tax=Curvibacter soli TaxID=3031331 RepID=UPI0023DBF3CC|nr:FixH family protein [Ramlibacter sp. H39-3-26]MDF1485341.1 FixH family protein [Ramlibacter sp. H39-3-26]
MSPTPSPSAAPVAALPWWKYGHVWLLISGPAAVVVAGILTAWIAVTRGDPVVDEDYYRKGIEINRTLAAEHARSLAPALQARNHAATPTPDLPAPRP